MRDLETDDVVDLVEDLGDEQQEAILEVLDKSDWVAARTPSVSGIFRGAFDAARTGYRAEAGALGMQLTICALLKTFPNSSIM